MMRWIGRDKKLLVTEIAEKNYYDNKNRLFFPKIKKKSGKSQFSFPNKPSSEGYDVTKIDR